MRHLLLICLVLTSCATKPAKPKDPEILFDKRVLVVIHTDAPPPPSWSDHALATITPLISPVASAIKLFFPTL